MRHFDTQEFLKKLLIIPILIGLLSGYTWASELPATIVSANIEAEVQNKSVLEILSIANKYSFKDLNLALQYAHFALEKAKRSGNIRDVFEVQRDLGFIYEDNTMWLKAIQVYEDAAKTAELISDSARTTIYNDLAIANRKYGNYRAAYNYYDKTLESAQRINDVEMIASSYHGLGHLHKEVGIHDKAISYYLQSLEISEARSVKEFRAFLDIIVSHNDIADTYLRVREIEKALNHVEKAYQLSLTYLKKVKERDRKDKDLLFEEANSQFASVSNKYGDILAAQKKFEGALKKYEEALKIYEAINYKTYIARSLMFIANVYLQQQQYEKAEEKFKECLHYEMQFLKPDLAKLYLNMGMLYKEKHNQMQAEKSFLAGLDIANQYDFKEVAQQANYQMFLICLDRHDNKRALAYLDKANELNDALFSVEKTRRTAEMELKFDMEKRDNEFKALKLKQRSLLLVGSIVAFVMIVIFLGYIIHMNRRNYQALKLKNEEVQQQYKKLEESNEILSQFAYAAAHDLKEPLRSIGSYIGLIQFKYGKELAPEANEYMTFVHNGVKRMYSLLTDLLEFSRVIAQQPGEDLLHPKDVLEDVENNLRSSIESKQARIEYNTDLPHIRMNRIHLTQLMQNLIGNSLKFTTTQPLVKIEAKQEDGHIILTVEDNGIGMKKEYGNKVFVLFQQLNQKGSFEGTGIGLTICKNIVDKYNGRIWFDSEENVGTKFYISIPNKAA
jgi:signal transduction histidine kinase